MKRFRICIAACLIASALSGCTALQSRPGGADRQATSGTAIFTWGSYSSDRLLAYAKWYGSSTADNQKIEYTQVMQALGRNAKDILTRLKAAIIFSTPAGPYRNTGRALALLNELQREKLNDDVITFIAVLKTYVDDRQKFEDNEGRLSQKSRYEQRRADELQQKLDELKNIEKNMIERDHAPNK
ncbi:MAG TPA: hypothetical protein VIE17_04080 [Methylophilaceae bacterium]